MILGQLISSSGEANYSTYLCLRASSAVNLLWGLKTSNLFKRSIAASEAPEKKE